MTLLSSATHCLELTRPCPERVRDEGLRSPANPNVLLAILGFGQFLMVLDVSIVNVALPAMQADLDIAASRVQYVASLYALTFGGLLIVGGRLADRYGRRRMLNIGLVVFGLASAATGVATGEVWLFAGRVVLGVAAALVSPAALSLALTIFDRPTQRQRALSVWGAVAAIGGVAGLLAGGVLTETLGWRWVFFIDVIPALAVAAIGARLLPESRIDDAPGIDLVGAVLLLVAVSSVLVAMTTATDRGWGEPWVIVLLATGVVAGCGLVVAESRMLSPLIEWGLFSNRTLTGSNIAAALLSALIVSQGVFVSIHLQTNAGYNPLGTGFALVPLTAVAAGASFGSGRVIGAIGLRWSMAASFALTSVGFVLLARLDADSGFVVDLLPAFVVLGLGIGVGFVVFTIGATDGVPDRRRGLASGVLSTSQHSARRSASEHSAPSPR